MKKNPAEISAIHGRFLLTDRKSDPAVRLRAVPRDLRGLFHFQTIGQL
ncbi:MAG TPA: hypothetical protein VNZ53_55125 [Steroidobacteraceae bacterium]|jgi:hypothetical protein|nr:hypothetical protein [Steroidobacteraceae bacterium]